MTTLSFRSSRRYRAFVGREGDNFADIVSDRLCDDVSGQGLDHTLMLVYEPDGSVCDVELAGRRSPVAWGFAAQELSTTGEGDVVMRVDVGASVAWGFDRDRRRLWVRIGGLEPAQWCRVGASDLWIGTNGDQLTGLAFMDAHEEDADWSGSEAWLDEIGAGDE